MNQWEWPAFAVGVILVLGTWLSVIGTLIVPRRVSGRIARGIAVVVAALFRTVARLSRRYETRDRILALLGPTLLLAQLGIWIVMFLVGFALIYVPFVADHEWGTAAILSARTLFPLGGLADTTEQLVIAFFAAGTGLVIVALQIAYLPVLYGSFNKRENLVTMLDARAGVPAWGPEVLARAELVDNVENLDWLYRSWEEWAADVAESHTTYPPLVYFRSPHPMRSWVTGLLAVLDAAALHLATRPLTAPPSARVMLRQGYQALRDVARLYNIPFNEDPKPDDPVQITRAEFDDALHLLSHVNWPTERTADEAWIHFRGWRVNYEAVAFQIADFIDAPPALWSGHRHRLPQALHPPLRPPHREPSKEAVTMRQETTARRRARGATEATPSMSVEHFHHEEADAGDDEGGDPN